MTILGDFREFLAGDDRADSEPAPNDPRDSSGKDLPLPFAGYESLDTRQVIDQLSDHSQAELEAVESYERSNRDREPVLNKLRYMRGDEPMPGYDDLPSEEIVSALSKADMTMIKRVRTYERKFANRRDIEDEITRVFPLVQAKQSASAAATDRPLGATKT